MPTYGRATQLFEMGQNLNFYHAFNLPCGIPKSQIFHLFVLSYLKLMETKEIQPIFPL